jgi:hypothetical protein
VLFKRQDLEHPRLAGQSTLNKQKCRPDRSKAQWKDLLFLPSLQNRSVIPTKGLRPTQEDEKYATKVCLALYQGTTLVVP